MAAEWVMPEQLRVSTSAFFFNDAVLTLSVSLHALLWRAPVLYAAKRRQTGNVGNFLRLHPQRVLFGDGRGAMVGALATQIIFSTSCVYCIVRPPSFAQRPAIHRIPQTWAITQPREILL